MNTHRALWLAGGLWCVTLATLMLEVLDTRLLSVLAWYHLTFLAISVAMLGMAAGAVAVFVLGDRVSPETVGRLLPPVTAACAVLVALSHLANLAMPFPTLVTVSASEVAAMTVATLVLTVPFIGLGAVVTMVLTRTGAPIGLMYGADLIGAAAGCLAIIAWLDFTDITSTALATAGFTAVGAWCFARAGRRRARGLAALVVACFCAAGVNAHARHPIGILYPKNRTLWSLLDTIQYSAWNASSYVLIRRPEASETFLWGGGTHAKREPATVAWAAIDGEAGTPLTKWDGNPASLGWVQYDVTALPYRLRKGRVGVIGVGGGRDILTAIWAGNRQITGIEMNEAFLDALRGPYRALTGIVDYPGVTLVHDEARSYLTRTPNRFDVLQMSLIDTWAATGAGAFTLSENGLYTREAWQRFLGALTPTGVFSVSRWYEPHSVSEATRLLALGVAALIDAGVKTPRQNLAMLAGDRWRRCWSRGRHSRTPTAPPCLGAADQYGFDVLVSPWTASSDPRVGRMTQATSMAQLDAATRDPNFELSPPTDAKPFFFNMLKPTAVWHRGVVSAGSATAGNLLATSTLLVLLVIVVVLIAAIVGGPLLVAGWPNGRPAVLGDGLAYFALIGLGFMFIQIPLLQRFSVYLGRPTYTFSIVLFAMILSAGAGSLLSERLDVRRRSLVALPLGIALAVVVETWALQPAMNRTVAWGLVGRTVIVAAFIAPLATGLGFCFPIGMRLAQAHDARSTAWMWGVNGAAGVLASIVAVMVSMWLGIQVNLWTAAALYACVAGPMHRLQSRRAVGAPGL